MATVWITGLLGFLGSHVARRFQTRGWTVAGIGRVRLGTAAEQWPQLAERGSIFVPGDISPERLHLLLNEAGVPDVVVHAAGTGSVGPSLSDPLADFNNSVATTATLLDFMRRVAPAARFVQTSSAAVYGVQPDGPIAETADLSPVSPYGAHKAAAELLCRQAHVSFGQPVTILRFFSLFGPGLRKQLLWDLACRLRNRPEVLSLNGTGEEKRDLLFIDDAVELIWRAGQAQAGFTVMNGGTGQATTVRKVATDLAHHLSPATRVEFDGTVRLGDPRELYADAVRLEDFGFRPAVSYDEGLRRYVAWIEREEWLR